MRNPALSIADDTILIGATGDDAPLRSSLLLEAGPDESAVAEGDDTASLPTLAAPPSVEEVDARQILRDRPDVFAAFYSEYYGPNNDRHSHAWVDRVGGVTPEDYARYWYKTYGLASGYAPSASSGVAAPLEDAAPSGRTTVDGIPLAKILSDRPDVFQAFFTEYYGPNNDRHSHAWVDRVGGTTAEDYANYWYNAYGKLSGYTPSGDPPASSEPPAAPAEDPQAPPALATESATPPDDLAGPAAVADNTTDFWSRFGDSRPLYMLVTADGFEPLPATDEEILIHQLQARTFLEADLF